MILLWLILIPLVGGAISLLASRWNVQASRWIALSAASLGLVVTAGLWFGVRAAGAPVPGSRWMYEWDQAWIPQLGIRFHLAMV